MVVGFWWLDDAMYPFHISKQKLLTISILRDSRKWRGVEKKGK
jgi:hypothetical protein